MVAGGILASCLRNICLILIGGMVISTPVIGQSSVPMTVDMGVKEIVYDINTITSHKSDSCNYEWCGIKILPDGILSTDISLKSLVESAYGITTKGAISGLPEWANTARFDIEFKMAPESAAAFSTFSEDQQILQRQYMLQLVLLDRFNLLIHHETKDSKIYELIIADRYNPTKTNIDESPKSELKTAIRATELASITVQPSHSTSQGILMSELADRLATRLHGLVKDKTELTGNYNVVLQSTPDSHGDIFDPTSVPSSSFRSESADVGPLKEQFRLSLKPTQRSVEIIVIDHVQTPVLEP